MHTAQEHIAQQTSARVAVTPVHLKGLTNICATFGKRKSSVRTWHEQGAPIAFDGCHYSAEYNQLQAWLVAYYNAGGR